MGWCASVPSPRCFHRRFTPGVKRFSCARTVPKLYLFSVLGIALSEKQIPRVVVNTEKWGERMEALERTGVLRRSAAADSIQLSYGRVPLLYRTPR